MAKPKPKADELVDVGALELDQLAAVLAGPAIEGRPDEELLGRVEVPAAIAELELRSAGGDDQARAVLDEALERGRQAAIRVGVRHVHAGELVTARAAGTVVANAAGDAMLERDPNGSALRDGDLVVVSLERGTDPIEALRVAADRLEAKREELERLAGSTDDVIAAGG